MLFPFATHLANFRNSDSVENWASLFLKKDREKEGNIRVEVPGFAWAANKMIGTWQIMQR